MWINRMVVALLAATLVAGCSAGSGSAKQTHPGQSGSSAGSPVGTGGSSVTRTPLRGCGPLPTSSGPAAAVATVRLTAPGTAAAASTIQVQASLDVAHDATRIITGPSSSDVLIVQDGQVVGRSNERRPALAVPLQLQSGRGRLLQAVPTSVVLSGCPSGTGPGDAQRSPLPAGDYSLVAVLGYSVDSLNGAADGGNAAPGAASYALVSEPVAVTVT
ncbi:hypothetical protein BH10ACT8_BH10ACT8_06710 [soil metagenome]